MSRDPLVDGPGRRISGLRVSLYETDLRTPLGDGVDDHELDGILHAAPWRKELKHHVREPGFRRPASSMSAIGG